MISAKDLKSKLLSYDQVKTDQEILKNWTMFSSQVADKDQTEQFFALLKNDSYPAILELKTDSKLAKNLCQKYESISPAKNIDPQNWIQIVCSGQLSDQELFDLIRLAYDQASLPK